MRKNANATRITAKNMAKRAQKGYSPQARLSDLEAVLRYIQLLSSLGFTNTFVSDTEPMYKKLTPKVTLELKRRGFRVDHYKHGLDIEWYL